MYGSSMSVLVTTNRTVYMMLKRGRQGVVKGCGHSMPHTIRMCTPNCNSDKRSQRGSLTPRLPGFFGGFVKKAEKAGKPGDKAINEAQWILHCLAHALGADCSESDKGLN